MQVMTQRLTRSLPCHREQQQKKTEKGDSRREKDSLILLVLLFSCLSHLFIYFIFCFVLQRSCFFLRLFTFHFHVHIPFVRRFSVCALHTLIDTFGFLLKCYFVISLTVGVDVISISSNKTRSINLLIMNGAIAFSITRTTKFAITYGLRIILNVIIHVDFDQNVLIYICVCYVWLYYVRLCRVLFYQHTNENIGIHYVSVRVCG